jgi:chromosome segregation ATPase|tara:strand:+ start:827 stop:1543 length:717 start_codon:yes stop_codon:yes gene_type:complete
MSFLLAGSAAMSIAGGLIGSGKAKRAARRAAKQAKALQAKLNHLENNRQAIINPYDNVTNLAGLASDLSNQLSNPFANLGVATQAAEMKIEQADISLANTLDTLRATGAGAGGATALAQAALQSKKEVAASIEQQEADNEKQRAQGEQVLQEKKMAEQQRMQKIAMDSAARQEDAMSKGRAYEFEAKENREQSRINRTAAQLQNMQNQAAQARRDQTSAITGMFGSLASIGASAYGGQ